MKITEFYLPLALIATLIFTTPALADMDAKLSDSEKATLQLLINSEDRSEKLRARNKYRNPAETLEFFGVKADHTVVEIWPGGQGGWYRSILEPYLKDNGTYHPVRSSDAFPKAMKKVAKESADRVLVFRAHGFMIYKKPAQQYYDALFKMVKPGGVFGIVDHRGDESIAQDPDGKNGYVNQSHVIMLAEKAGFLDQIKNCAKKYCRLVRVIV